MQNESPKRNIDKETLVRAIRLSDPDYFRSLNGKNRKTIVNTFERGLVPILRNVSVGIEKLCEMCRESKGKSYDPAACLRNCKVLSTATKAEELLSSVTLTVTSFRGDVPDGGISKGKTTGKTNGKDDGGGDESPAPVLAG